MHTKTARDRGKVRAQYRWAYATSTLQENGQNQHEKGGWAFNTSWAYNTYSTVHVHMCIYFLNLQEVVTSLVNVTATLLAYSTAT